MEHSEGVDESCFNKFLKSFSFFFCKTFQTNILFWSCKIIFGVRNIQITTKNDWLLFFQIFAIGKESGIPLLVTKGNARQVVFCIRSIDRNNIEILEFSCNNAAFCPRIAIFISNKAIF